jgi:hypothetical protein
VFVVLRIHDLVEPFIGIIASAALGNQKGRVIPEPSLEAVQVALHDGDGFVPLHAVLIFQKVR